MNSKRKSEADSIDIPDNLITVKEEDEEVVPIQEKTETEDSKDSWSDSDYV